LPTAKSGVVTAVLLGVARIVGETAPLLFTAFGSQILNGNVFSHPQESLPLEVWSNVRQAQPVLISLAYQAGFVLMALVLVLFVAARIAGRTKKSKSQRSWVSRITGGSSPGSSSGRTTGGSSGGSTGGTPNSSPSGSPNSSLHPANADLVALLGGDGPTES
jgi:phosphate transport system permease protein